MQGNGKLPMHIENDYFWRQRNTTQKRGKQNLFLKLSKEYLDVSFFHSYFFFLPALWGLLSLSSQPRPSAVRTWRPNHWTAREFPGCFLYYPVNLLYS